MCIQLGLSIRQKIGAIAIKWVDLLKLAQRTDRLHRTASGQMCTSLLVQLSLMIAWLCWRRGTPCRTRAPSATGWLAAIIRASGSEIAEHAISFGEVLAAPAGVFLLVRWSAYKAIGMVF